jgi:shikimate dehydrogenase
MKLYGLIGEKLSHSFSPTYFSHKFKSNGIDAKYEAFELAFISDFQSLIQTKEIHGLNVTIPYKEAIIPFLDSLSNEAEAIGAVNTIQFKEDKLIGHNTDWLGFWQDLSPLLHNSKKQALVLGNGGSSKAVKFALEQNGWEVSVVSRGNNGDYHYSQLNDKLVIRHPLIINTTPMGMYPNVSKVPPISLDSIHSDHVIYDLIYNPEETLFLRECKKRGATVKNGYGMLLSQAELSYAIWQENTSNSLGKSY